MRSRFVPILVSTLLAAAAASAAEPVFSVAAHWQAEAPAAGTEATLEIVISIEPGWHINSNAPLDPYLIPTEVRLDLPSGWTGGPPVFPPHRLATFAFSEEPLAVFEHDVTVSVPVHRDSGAAATSLVHGAVVAQACNDTTCLAPVTVAFAAPTGIAGAPDLAGPPAGTAPPPLESYETPETAAGGLGGSFIRAGLLLQIGLVFLAGLALNLTPCVYPLIPITVGFFLAQKEASRRRTWMLAGVYVLGMSVTYSILGVVAALTGQLFGAALQSPWVVGVIVAILLILASSMFGLWELRVPGWATRVSGARSGLAGALVMGLVVGLVAAPCIGPFVLGLLTYVGRQQNVLLGFVLFFTLSLGLGLPYLFLAVFSGAMDRLPSSGAWMIGIRNFFGVLLVGLAAYFVRPFLPEPLGDRMLAAVLVLGGLYLLVVARPGHEQAAVDRVMRLVSAGVLVAGVLMFPTAAPPAGVELEWQPYDQTAVDQALASDTPVVLDFYADWCAPCKELEEKTFSDPAVAARLADFRRFKVNLTRNDSTTDQVRRRFGVAGVPTIAFFDGGVEVAGARLTGFEPPSAFLHRLDRVARD